MDGIYEFLDKNSYYVVFIITLLIWLGIFLYMRTIDKKVRNLEKDNL